MNPSSSGWVKKLLKQQSVINCIHQDSQTQFYHALRDCGFIYGSNVLVYKNAIVNSDYTDEELCKINFLIAFKYIHHHSESESHFIESVIDFYSKIKAYKSSFLQDLLGEKRNSELLEKIIHKRIQITDNILNKSFNYFITNALLFIDILAYKQFLNEYIFPKNYIQQFESVVETVVMTVLNSKNQKSDYDESLINLFEQSLRYGKDYKLTYQHALEQVHNHLETLYIVDMACMATWGDATVDAQEQIVLDNLGKELGLEASIIDTSVTALNSFYQTHTDNIVLLNSKNLVKTFYNNSSTMVSKLITRNGKRLMKELRESKELMKLLTQSTVRELTAKEQKKVQEQLLDIFKSIPSLAIFLLPGGTLLLPFVIKFIPKLLPSAFDENRVDDE